MTIEEKFLQAMERGDVVAVDRMLKSKEIDVNEKLDGQPVLIRGIDCGNPDIVSCILENGADVDIQDVWCGSPLHWAIRNYKLIRDVPGSEHWGQDEKQRSFNSIFEAYKKLGSQKFMEAAFIERNQGHENGHDKVTLFLAALREGVSDVVLKLLDLINEETLEFLNVGNFRFSDGANAFHYVHRLNDKAMNALFDRLPFKQQLINESNTFGFTPLNIVMFMTRSSVYIHRQHPAAVVLLKNGANPNLPFKYDQTPLHWAIHHRRSSTCELLLRAGCRTDIFDINGRSALKIAISSDGSYFHEMETRIKLIKLLLAYGVDLNKELYLYADDELPVEYRGPAYEGQINAPWFLHTGLLEKLRELRRSGVLNTLKHRCRVAVLRNLKINEIEIPEQNDTAIDSLPLPNGLKSYLTGDGDKVLAMLDILRFQERGMSECFGDME